MEYRFVICDDEKIYRDNLKNYVEDYFNDREDSYETIETSGGEELLKLDGLLSIDIAFLDIELEDMKGINLSRKLKEINNNVLIVFVSSHPSYIEEVYDQVAFNFITKPIKDRRFIRVMDKALRAIEGIRHEKYYKIVNKKNMKLIPYMDIVCFRKDRNNLEIVLEDETLKTRGSLDKVEEEVESDYFLRCHNSYIVNKRRIIEQIGNNISLKGHTEEIPVGREYKKVVLNEISKMIEGE